MRLLFILVAFSISTNVSSQSNEQYIEINVEDTMTLTPEEIIYVVMLTPEYGTSDTTSPETTIYVEPIQLKREPRTEEKQQIRKLIKDLKLDTLTSENYTISPNEYEYETLFTIKFTSLEQLKRFIKAAKEIPGIMGVITEVRTSKKEAGEKILVQKILQKAFQQATDLANRINRKAGEVIQIKLDSFAEEGVGGWTSYPPMSALSPSRIGSEARIIIYRKLTVRYALK